MIKLKQVKSTLRTTFSQSSLRGDRSTSPNQKFTRLNKSSLHSSRLVQEENNKMFSRLLQVKPTINTSKFTYKMNPRDRVFK